MGLGSSLTISTGKVEGLSLGVCVGFSDMGFPLSGIDGSFEAIGSESDERALDGELVTSIESSSLGAMEAVTVGVFEGLSIGLSEGEALDLIGVSLAIILGTVVCG